MCRFGSFAESTLQGYLASVEQDVKRSRDQAAMHYVLGQMVNLSADAIKAAEAGLVAKVSRRALHIGEGWEEVVRTAFRIIGHPAAEDSAGEVIWKDFETRSEAQRVDALVKMRTLGVPIEVLWARWGASPQEIEQWRVLRAQEERGEQLMQCRLRTASGRCKAQAAKLLSEEVASVRRHVP